MRLAFTLTTAAYAALLGVAAFLLPARVPLHFGLAGEVDRWGSRAEAILVLGVVGVVMALVLGWTARALPDRPLSSPWLNLPHKAWWTATPEREAEARRRLVVDLYALGAASMLLLAMVLVSVVVAARAAEPALETPFQVLLGGSVAGLLVWSLWMSLFRYRPEEGR